LAKVKILLRSRKCKLVVTNTRYGSVTWPHHVYQRLNRHFTSWSWQLRLIAVRVRNLRKKVPILVYSC